MIEGRTEYDNFVEENSWKYALLEDGQREAGDTCGTRSSRNRSLEKIAATMATGTTISADAAKNSLPCLKEQKVTFFFFLVTPSLADHCRFLGSINVVIS
ncbi:hypothetical protein Bca52824_060261 [Brassica carinata]|uniref:Uncharacterized protein n=1 Tax=Brassica carinata TaxID=52824 RepID=A0A8X7QX57_BRACI|nr:hypothetical protein Bca52824_060261 [Brassica carinata]